MGFRVGIIFAKKISKKLIVEARLKEDFWIKGVTVSDRVILPSELVLAMLKVRKKQQVF